MLSVLVASRDIVDRQHLCWHLFCRCCTHDNHQTAHKALLEHHEARYRFLRRAFFRCCQILLHSQLSADSVMVLGELSSRLINDSATLQYLAQFTTQNTLQSIIKFFGALAAMFFTRWELALIATSVTPINWLLVRRTGTTVGRYGVVQNKAMAAANALAVETLGAIPTVHSNVCEEVESSKFVELLNEFLRVIKFTVYGAQTISVGTSVDVLEQARQCFASPTEGSRRFATLSCSPSECTR